MLIALWTLLAGLYTGTAAAGPLERLVMPGPVIAGHAKYEDDCDQCHQAFRKGEQRALCLACHKLVDADVSRDEGLHGRHPEVARFDCKHCHTDHKGRDASIVSLDADTFDHVVTDFQLQGSHLRVACDRCHQAPAKRRDAPGRCADCHRDGDPHRGHLGMDCTACHDQMAWRQVRFDHAKTKFPLGGKHEKAPCAGCHPGETYASSTPPGCYGCHVVDDVHQRRYGETCGDCHDSVDWKRPRFDHGKTKYPLLGKHREVACELCHPGDVLREKPSQECVACHRRDDVHQQRYGEKCEECHGVEEWRRSSFDHAKTRYPLQGRHREARCDACHPGRLVGDPPGTGCATCHAVDDRHKGRYGRKCGTCHSQDGWPTVRFDHETTPFPLRGLHREVACAACHQRPSYAQQLPTGCRGCHSADDVHGGRFGAACPTCHTERGWKPAAFDHDTTRYPLVNRHRDVACDRCHPNRPDAPAPDTACAACHRDDDVHGGAQGTACQTCHSDAGWSTAALFDHDLTRLPLAGLHALVPCEACHPDRGYRDTPLTCAACHAAADVHRLALGPECGACHTPNGWDLWNFDHGEGSRFPLAGKHRDLACAACHERPTNGPVRRDAACNACHRRDDVHRGRYGPACDRCHSDESFQQLTHIR